MSDYCEYAEIIGVMGFDGQTVKCTLTGEECGSGYCHYDERKEIENDILKEVSR